MLPPTEPGELLLFSPHMRNDWQPVSASNASAHASKPNIKLKRPAGPLFFDDIVFIKTLYRW